MNDKRIVLTDAKGGIRSRPFSEMEKIWEALVKVPAIHVDSVLQGCGSCRNQPETIFANLPYVSWLRINGRKHLALTPSKLHPLGMLLKMDSIESQRLLERIDEYNRRANSSSLSRTSAIVITDRVKKMVDTLSNIIGGRCTSISAGVYQILDGDKNILILNQSIIPGSIKQGFYPVINSNFELSGVSNSFQILDKTISLNTLEESVFFIVHQ
ncbi:MAG: hypothetical protein LHW64_08045 [Candidatus Cloacimonetes bacterium]|nr:hypothetical protein [Candidatus Cloacimonadota bacterium]MDY0230063.1 hypothetical protein [Candidatus Cloacimonadaceae bacterium]